ncbi:MAG: GatB/YqeY domain-containing protein [Gammaproteobacteria bacterium]|nr:MAG: GatB/YqeY domain-containing protein [Gammaproteobacteria bacterium]
MSLKARVTADMHAAMRAGEKDRLSLIRMIQAAIQQREVDERITLDDVQVLALIDKMVKQRRESLPLFEAGGRADLVAKETAEIGWLTGYLPAQLGEQELEQVIRAAIAASGAATMKDMGRAMALIRPQVQGRADMAAVSARLKAALGG